MYCKLNDVYMFAAIKRGKLDILDSDSHHWAIQKIFQTLPIFLLRYSSYFSIGPRSFAVKIFPISQRSVIAFIYNLFNLKISPSKSHKFVAIKKSTGKME